MKLIAHRGNLYGQDKELENSQMAIFKALDLGYDCEVDLWYLDKALYLGHDKPVHRTSFHFVKTNSKNLWCHAKNQEALEVLNDYDTNFFWHDTDKFTMTSKGDIWCYPSDKVYNFGINVMPEWNKHSIGDFKDVSGVCSDFITFYRS